MKNSKPKGAPQWQPLIDELTVRVRFNEIDSMRRVWHGRYVGYYEKAKIKKIGNKKINTYMEDGRESFGLHYPGIGYADISQSGIYAPVFDLHVRHLSFLELNDEAVITTAYEYHPGARLDFNYEVRRKRDGILCATGHSTQLFIDPDGNLMGELPDYYKTWQERFLKPVESPTT